jgi:hypothetical protein
MKLASKGWKLSSQPRATYCMTFSQFDAPALDKPPVLCYATGRSKVGRANQWEPTPAEQRGELAELQSSQSEGRSRVQIRRHD